MPCYTVLACFLSHTHTHTRTTADGDDDATCDAEAAVEDAHDKEGHRRDCIRVMKVSVLPLPAFPTGDLGYSQF
jgi:hypothetical protein